MERIIRSYAVRTFNRSGSSGVGNDKSHLWDNPPPKKVSICGAIETNTRAIITNTHTGISTNQQQQQLNNQNNCSKSLQMLLNQRPSILVYLVLLTSTLFLTTLMIWVWRERIVEIAHIRGKVFDPVNLERYQAATKGKFVRLNISNNQPIKQVNLMHSRVVLEAQISKQQAILCKKGIQQIKMNTVLINKLCTMYGKIKNNLPDTYSGKKNTLFEQVKVALENNYPMSNRRYKILQTEREVTNRISLDDSTFNMYLE